MTKKQKAVAWAVAILLLMGACQARREGADADGRQQPSALEGNAPEEEGGLMGVRPEECLSCGNGREEAALYWGQENVGFISLNSFEIAYVGINRYDDYGSRVNESTGGTMIRLERGEEDGFSAFIFENTDRGFADGTLTLNGDAAMHTAKAAQYLCKDCLDGLSALSEEDSCGMGIINFATRELRVLKTGVAGFDFGDFYVFCDFMDRDEEGRGLTMGFLILHCPVRGG